ncbi:MAG: aspartyl protease family protein [Acidobacteria bacterium]|nr:aspartyl protease family protein [Acidobacteriota bacterium]
MRLTRTPFVLAAMFTLWISAIPVLANDNQTTPVDPTEDVENGLKALRGGRYDDAVLRLERAVTSAPDSVPAQLGLAWAYLKMRKYGSSVQQSVKVLRKTPDNARANALVGVALMRVGFLQEALGSFEAALRTDRNEVLAIAGKAELDLYVGNLAESLRRAREAVARSPREPDFLYLQGQCASRLERYEEAAEAYERFLDVAVDLDGDRRSRIRGLVSLYRRLNGRNLYAVHGAKSVDVPISLTDSRLPAVDVKINGKGPFRFVIDSGAGFVVVSEEVASKLKLRRVAEGGTSRGVSGTGRFEIVYGVLDRLEMGQMAMDSVPTYIRKIHDSTTRGKIDGYIGLSVMSHFRIAVDYEKGVLEFRPQSEPAVPLGPGDFEVPYRMTSGGMMSVSTDIGAPVPLNFIVDTGASSTVVSSKAFGRYNLESKQHKGVAVRVVGAGGVTDNVPVVVLDRLQLTGSERGHDFVRAIVLDLDPVNETAGFEQSGIVGSDLLRFFRVEFDFIRSVVVFRPNSRMQTDSDPAPPPPGDET